MSTTRPSSTGRPSDVERIIVAAEVDTTFSGKKARYRGRRSTWPGALFLILLVLGSIGGLTYYGIALHDQVKSSGPTEEALAARYGSGTPIADGRPQGQKEESIEVTNPETYKDRNCEQPTWLSKNGQIFYQLSNGKDVPFAIKGVNWMGMQENRGVPKGLWDSSRDGSTLYRIGQFLVNNKFNAVRLPLSIDAVARNVEVDMSLINTNSNRALFADRYLTLLGLIIQGLGNQGLGVVLDFHVLSAIKKEDNGLWTGTSIHMEDIKKAIGNLAEKLCTGKHFNIIGIDLKDGVQGSATWGDKSETDWAAAATELGNEVISQCSSWLVFVQGVQGSPEKLAFAPEDRLLKTKFWPGADLSGVADAPIELDETDKLVYAPQYFSNSKIPQPYFFSSGDRAGDKISDYVESEDDLLKENIEKSMEYMFGPALESDAAVILSQFGGLVGKEDATEMKTSTRIVEFITSQMVDKKLAGGFWMALNPDTYWNYRVPDNDTDGDVNGVLETSWRKANMDVLTSLKPLDKMENLRFVPCVEQPEG